MTSIWENALRDSAVYDRPLHLAPAASERPESEHCQVSPWRGGAIASAADAYAQLPRRSPVVMLEQVSSLGAEYALPKDSIDALRQSSMSTPPAGAPLFGMEQGLVGA
jgi:hypothetical protein